jgi:hypothetical protein
MWIAYPLRPTFQGLFIGTDLRFWFVFRLEHGEDQSC